ncbi:hypothetical protein ElyMa_003532300 [Elysia marginata]|uniref:Uncharacterized protein n=1 Tax=Elysia marginata TaxID=1093978 RepID=A0AAV4EIP1_9GAST|nr:hypothetical protein ElyMa_003532300 [Elysia marginata]
MVQEEVLNFKRMRNQIPNMNKSVHRQKVKITDIRIYVVRKGDPLVTIHYNLDQPAVQMNLFQTGRKTLEMCVQKSLEPVYSRKLRIDTKKLKDLEKLCSDGIIPRAYHTFYKDLASCHESPTDLTSGSEFEDKD